MSLILNPLKSPTKTEMMYHWPGLGPGQYCIPRILPSYQSCPPRWTHYALVDCGEKEREVVIVFGSLPRRLNVEDGEGNGRIF